MKVFGEILFLFVAVTLYASNEIINGKLQLHSRECEALLQQMASKHRAELYDCWLLIASVKQSF